MMQPVRRTPTLMSINNSLLTRVPVWQGFSGRNANEAKYKPSLFSSICDKFRVLHVRMVAHRT